MIDIDTVKLVLFDFDDTLCLHSSHGEVVSKVSWHASMIMGDIDIWTRYGCKPNRQMKKFMDYCGDRGIRMGLISATLSSICADMKIEWVRKYYEHALHNYCVGNPRDKKVLLQSIIEGTALCADNILLIDDYFDNLRDACEIGAQAASPMEVVNFINKLEQV